MKIISTINELIEGEYYTDKVEGNSIRSHYIVFRLLCKRFIFEKRASVCTIEILYKNAEFYLDTSRYIVWDTDLLYKHIVHLDSPEEVSVASLGMHFYE